MATAMVSFKLSNRAPKKPIRKLPTAIELPGEATVEDAKKAIARQSGIRDFNRIGLFNPKTGKTLKDRKAVLGELKDVADAGELQVKDLGPQLAWRTVFFVEYLGPILFHLAVPLIRPTLYAVTPPFLYAPATTATTLPMTPVQWTVFAMFMVHFGKREAETLLVHKFSANTMPAFNIFRNSFFYWAVAGALAAYDVYAPGSAAGVRAGPLGALDYLGLAVFAVGEACNLAVHVHLAGLRKPGGTEKGIPRCVGSAWVTSPNYMFEVVAWVGVILVSRSWAVVLFIAIGTMYMAQWSRGKEKALRQEFGDRYKKKRYTMLPFLI